MCIRDRTNVGEQKCGDNEEWNKLEMTHNITHSDVPAKNMEEYNANRANIIARVMADINKNIQRKGINFTKQFGDQYMAQFSQQYIFEKGLKKFGDQGRAAAKKELNQLHRQGCFQPVDMSTKSDEEKRKC